jgi:arylsulfatase A-like enzyme
LGLPSCRPNFVFLITDQERYPQYWPDGWAETNLPSRQRLAERGVTFTNAFCSASMCSASRASLFTSQYPSQHGVKCVLMASDTSQSTLQPPPEQPNLASMLASAGYDVQYRGKWHLSKDPTGTADVQSSRDLERYGFRGWQPPESGQDELPAHFGGGDTNYDAQYAEQAAEFLRNAHALSPQPFALVVCLSNPHDIMAHPSLWNQPSFSDTPPWNTSNNYGKDAPGCFDQGISLPPDATLHENLAANFKPASHAQSLALFNARLGALDTAELQHDYVNFYAYLHTLTDGHFGTILDALESNPALNHKTIVIRLADHGEMGLSHGGLRQKTFNAYEETIHVPLVISNPALFKGPVRSDALISLVDIMPTIAALADVPDRDTYDFKGRDFSGVIQDAVDNPGNPTAAVQDAVLFTTDEVAQQVVEQPYHVRCLRERDWKFVMNFDPVGGRPPQFELYDLINDPMELQNRAHPDAPYYDEAKTNEMKDKLANKLAEIGEA